MKKIIVLGLCLLFPVVALATNQPQYIGNAQASKIVLDQRTQTQMNTLLPDTTGQMILCIDCTQSSICVSSGSNSTTSVGAWVVLGQTGTFVGSTFSGFTHCK
jgi:hypothetical protein